MITLSQRLKKQQDQANSRISIRDRLLARELQELGQILPHNCNVCHENVNNLSSFTLTIKPTEGFWQGGCFKFAVKITEDYNMVPPLVKCMTKLWHPNISENGEVCLSLLRQHSVDGLGWSPTRRLNDVLWGLLALFTSDWKFMNLFITFIFKMLTDEI
ncbi:hypothetical protein FQA39_LY07158 [Lamprigera yunnana]|nr:hypothetical protein FQA39_LY07158 [Lamprigera yunnana]